MTCIHFVVSSTDAFVPAQGDTVYATVVPEVDERELEKMVNPIVQEYFEHGDTKEVQVSEPSSSLGAVCPGKKVLLDMKISRGAGNATYRLIWTTYLCSLLSDAAEGA